MFNGEVADAFLGVDCGAVRRDTFSGTCVDASAAVAAGVRRGEVKRSVRGEKSGCENGCDEAEGAESGDEKLVVTADLSESAFCGPVSFTQGG